MGAKTIIKSKEWRTRGEKKEGKRKRNNKKRENKKRKEV
jgi:hypothetical protein